MFCSNCGMENEDSAKFCKGCGQQLVNENPTDEKVKETKKANTKVVKGVFMCLAILIVVVAILFLVNGRSTINLNKYTTVEVTGCDGYGKANVVIDWETIEDKYGEKLKRTEEFQEDSGILYELYKPMDVLKGCINVELDTDSKLKNGATITYNWVIDDDVSRYLNCKVKCKDDTYKVSGLKEVSYFDAFADLQVTFDGFAPDGDLCIQYSGDKLDSHDFTSEKDTGLSNGDKIKITIDENAVEECAEEFGMVPKESEREYVVEGLASYISDVSEISDDVLEQMKQQAVDTYNAHVAKDWDEYITLKDFKFIGTYLLTSKDENSISMIKNELILVYKATSKIDYVDDIGSFSKDQDAYWYLAYDNVVKDKDGKVVVDIMDYNKPYDCFVVESDVNAFASWYYEGYATLDALYKEIIMSSADGFNCQDNVEKQ